MEAPSVSPPVACPDCDLLQRIPALPPGGRARCARCRRTLAREPFDPRDVPLALALAALIAFVVANATPLMSLSAVGRSASTTIPGGVYAMWQHGEEVTAVLVGFCAIAAPGCYLLFVTLLLIAARRAPAPWWAGEMLRWAHHLQAWSMSEVMMLGILVALIKIAELAAVDPGVGMYAVGAVMLLTPAIIVTFDPREIWKRVEWVDGETPRRSLSGRAVEASP
jgi:paraquat-inducible protein A